MKVLIAEDDLLFRKLLQDFLQPEFEVTAVDDGTQAWEILSRTNEQMLAILDWVMPGMTGPEICRKARALLRGDKKYLVLLTSRNSAADVIAGIRAGADDYITKPFQPEELRTRVRLGQRILELESSLAEYKQRATAAEGTGSQDDLVRTGEIAGSPKSLASLSH